MFFSASGEACWSELLFFNEANNKIALYVLLVAYSGVVSNILLVSLAAKAKILSVPTRFYRSKAKSNFTDILMVIVVTQILVTTIVNTLMSPGQQPSYYGYVNALAITCLLTILFVIGTFTSYVTCCFFCKDNV